MNEKLKKLQEKHEQFVQRLHREYTNFKYDLLRLPTEKVYEESIKITFYREAYRYLCTAVLLDEEYEIFNGYDTLQRLWFEYALREMPKQTNAAYLSQLIKLHKENNLRGALCG